LIVVHLLENPGRYKEAQVVHAMVHFKNRYMVMEVFIDAGRGEVDPVILTQFNITKVIRDSIQLNFGECGLAASLGSLQGDNDF
jgi:ribonuclease P/MRP protein subunit POP5